MRGSSRAILLAVCLATSATARYTPNTIFERETVCPDAAYVGCNNTGLPGDFCCPTGSNCIPLAANTTLLCCPTGQTCQTIKPITCNISYQNITKNPDNTLKTTALGATLPSCAGQCCPFGFSCNTNNNCVMDADQSIAPTTSSSSTTSTPTSTSTSSPSANPTTTSSPTSSTPLPLTQTCTKFPIPAILAGFFPGLVLGILLAILGLCCWGNSHKRSSSSHHNTHERRRSGSSFGNISEPQPLDREHDMRTDFLRKPPMTPSSQGSTPGRRNTMKGRMNSLFRKSRWDDGQGDMATPPIPLNINKNNNNGNGNNNGGRPVTPENRQQREVSEFYGNVPMMIDEREHPTPSPPGLGLGSRRDVADVADSRISYNTTWTDIMPVPEPSQSSGNGGTGGSGAPLAGLPKGQPFRQYGSPPR
ncbi:uncharacterized protein LY89DRAFT_294139 [Mollisia scopiformis]|uniref:Uncharacterized protein n=1 Tax=Mollisia scopiformis TaxID=149040 RepID=A0A194XRI2_MOLSC|nr:uncharacterized protein LY89DRAFT_294139 [Mollisia scopiformis]KUJ22337.1 hypothetical protein LY89DRAFT_294139 [Mollisia scopiformis]